MASRARVAGVAVFAALLVFTASPTVAVDHIDSGSADSGAHPEHDPEELGDSHDHGFGEDSLTGSTASAMTSNFFNESFGCGGPAGVATPMSTTNSSPGRSLPSDHQVRGPWGDFFGRDYADVSGSLVSWVVPMSGGRVVKVHERALPAYQLVTQNLAAAAASGKHYQARMASAWVWRRIGGSYRMSTHAFGTTVDINWDTNPYRGDNVLITDMPQWYVSAWKDAGFCWGGDWVNIKDPMHFSWKGPLATPGYGELGAPYAPKTSPAAHDRLAFSGDSAFGPVEATDVYAVLDANRDGSPDLWRARRSGVSDLVVEYARSSRDFGHCGISLATVPGAGSAPGEVVLADVDGDSRPDVVVVDDSGPTVTLRVQAYRDDFRTVETHATAAPPAADGSYGFADYDRDGHPDLYVIHRQGETSLSVWSGADDFTTLLITAVTALPATANDARWRIHLGDRDVDGIPDLFAVRVGDTVQLRVVTGAQGYTGPVTTQTTAATPELDGVYGLGDYDGDGRADLYGVDSSGAMEIWLGGNQTGDLDFWFRQPDWSCDGIGSFVPWDFNGDRIADLTVGGPGKDVGGLVDAGQVHVFYGDGNGPSVVGDQLWHQDTADVAGPAESGDRFGSSLASGDFDGDGYGDLAVGAPDDGVGAIARAGIVNVIHGSRNGLDGGQTQMWHQDSGSVPGTAGVDAAFGSVLASGDFDGDGRDDLAIGVPGQTINGNPAAGSVNVLYGSRTGLTATGSQLFRLRAGGLPGKTNGDERFGASLAVGDFNGDGIDDLAVGAPGHKRRGLPGAGVAVVLFGSSDRLSTEGHQFLSQRGDVYGVPRENDRFAEALGAGDFDGDGFDDLGIGVPGKRRAGKGNAGLVHILRGSEAGVTTDGQQKWAQSSPGVPGAAQQGDQFGASLAGGDFDEDGFDDLAIGVPREDLGNAINAGSVLVLEGGVGGLRAEGAIHLRAGYDGVAGVSESQDLFGATLVAADLNGDRYEELVIGVPQEDVGATDAGAVVVVYGTAFGLDPAASDIWHQDVAGVEGTARAGDLMGTVT